MSNAERISKGWQQKKAEEEYKTLQEKLHDGNDGLLSRNRPQRGHGLRPRSQHGGRWLRVAAHNMADVG